MKKIYTIISTAALAVLVTTSAFGQIVYHPEKEDGGAPVQQAGAGEQKEIKYPVAPPKVQPEKPSPSGEGKVSSDGKVVVHNKIVNNIFVGSGRGNTRGSGRNPSRGTKPKAVTPAPKASVTLKSTAPAVAPKSKVSQTLLDRENARLKALLSKSPTRETTLPKTGIKKKFMDPFWNVYTLLVILAVLAGLALLAVIASRSRNNGVVVMGHPGNGGGNGGNGGNGNDGRNGNNGYNGHNGGNGNDVGNGGGNTDMASKLAALRAAGGNHFPNPSGNGRLTMSERISGFEQGQNGSFVRVDSARSYAGDAGQAHNGNQNRNRNRNRNRRNNQPQAGT